MRVLALAMLVVCSCTATNVPGIDDDADGFDVSEDCDDANASVRPGASESCNDRDDDCDGAVDEGVQTAWFADLDTDGYGDPQGMVLGCSADLGMVGNGNDCDDTDPEVHPAAEERCDGVDNDCQDGELGAIDAPTWYTDADVDGFGDASSPVRACEAPEGVVDNDEDCDDGDAMVHPGATEVCDGADNDCDGVPDGASAVDALPWYTDADADGHAAIDATATAYACEAPAGFAGPRDDCDDGDSATHPGANEFCDGIDQDCNDVADDDAVDAVSWFADRDADGYGDIAVESVACDAPSAMVADATDCDDDDAAVHPGATEVCNAIDDDCDGATDPAYYDSDFDAAVSSALTVNGDATQLWSGADGYLALTVGDFENGTAFLTDPIPGDVFYASLRYTVSGGNGGEGLSFAFLDETDPTSRGDDEDGLGLRGLSGYGVVLDTYRNSSTESRFDHLSLVEAADFDVIAAGSTIPTVSDGGEQLLEVWFDNGDVDVAIDGTTYLSTTISGYALSELMIGVTAGTSAHYDTHAVDDLFVGCPP